MDDNNDRGFILVNSEEPYKEKETKKEKGI